MQKNVIRQKFSRSAPPHPYGVRPFGNLLVDSLIQSDIQEASKKSGPFHLLAAQQHERILVDILDLLSAKDLANLMKTTRFLYCWSTYDEMWKRLCISQFKSKSVQWCGTSWRETFAANYLSLSDKNDQELPIMKPISMPSVYSDQLFLSWLGATVPIDAEWLERDNIDRRSGLSKLDFIREYEEPNRPVLIQDIVTKWPAMKEWTEEKLLAKYGHVVFRAEAMDCTLADYFKYANAVQGEESPFYLFDKHFCENCPEMSQQYSVPEYFQDDMFYLLGDQRPDYRWLIIGPARSGSSFHKDPNATSAWNATITGSKKWIMFPPDVLPPGVYPSEDGSEVTTPTSLMEWLIHFYHEAQRMPTKPIECITRPGDLIFVPSGWWHMVINLEPTVAVTQNYVSPRNLLTVVDFLQQKKPQISGVSCSLADQLGDLFESAVNETHPELIEEERQKARKKLGAAVDQPAKRPRIAFWSQVTADSKSSESTGGDSTFEFQF